MAFEIEFRNLTKTFGGVTALRNVSLAIRPGECHALMGENGAGKSTLARCLAGIHHPDSGAIFIDQREVKFRNPAAAAAAGIGMVHQELAFCPDLSVAENLALGRYPRKARLFLSRHTMHRRARELLARIGAAGATLDVARPMRELSTAQEQIVQIAAAIGSGAAGGGILIFDEPTASLSEREAAQLFTLIEDLKKHAVTIIYVSHRLPEVFRLCDAISVLRDGQYVGALERQTAWPADARDQLVQMMIGRPVADYFPQHVAAAAGKILLDVQQLASPGKFADISFHIRAGEIVGLAGLVGAGRSEIARALFGLDPRATGRVLIDGIPLKLGSTRRAMRRGLALVPEDRKRQGLVLMMGGRENFSLPLLDRLSRLGFLKSADERRQTENYFARLHVKTPSLRSPVSSMSGGNQQKVVIAKWLACLSGIGVAPMSRSTPRILIVDEPTRGIDVGAKAAIHHLLDDLAQAGVAILLISSELPEVLGISTRILIMREGRLVAELPRAQATQETALRLMAGV